MPSLDALPLLKSQFLVSTDLFPNAAFTTFSGLVDKAETTQYPDGLEFRKFYLRSMAVLQEMNIQIPHDPENHAPLILSLKDNPCQLFTTKITPVRCDPNEIAGPSLYLLNCQLTQVQAFSADRNGNEMAMVQLDFVADDYRIDF